MKLYQHTQAIVERRRHLVGEVAVVGGIVGPTYTGLPYREEAIVKTHFERSLVVGILLSEERYNGLEQVDTYNQTVKQGVAVTRAVFEALALFLLAPPTATRTAATATTPSRPTECDYSGT